MIRALTLGGKVLAAVPTQEITNVRSLKLHVAKLHGVPRFRQRVFIGNKATEDDAALDAPTDFQLIFLEFATMSPEQAFKLTKASGYGCADEVEKLLQIPLNPNSANVEEWGPLLAAADHGHLEVVDLLLEARADPVFQGFEGTALVLAGERGHVDITRSLLKAGAGMEVSERHWAIYRTSFGFRKEACDECVKLLVAADLEDCRGRRGLISASKDAMVKVIASDLGWAEAEDVLSAKVTKQQQSAHKRDLEREWVHRSVCVKHGSLEHHEDHLELEPMFGNRRSVHWRNHVFADLRNCHRHEDGDCRRGHFQTKRWVRQVPAPGEADGIGRKYVAHMDQGLPAYAYPQTRHADWHKRYEVAKALVTEDRADKIHELVVELETKQPLKLLGATAIEDRLQDEVADTIAQLRAAGIRVWVLTGDKVDTAISIAMSCQLLTEEMDNFVIDGDSEQSLLEVLTEALQSDRPALTIAGSRLAEALESEDDRALLFKVGQRCRSVVCCRVSPKQKADVVDLVKSLDHSAVTLSIGDGANDVSMIVAAHVGVGLSGKEGAQAAYAADFALPEFRLLKRSIFAHGREAYRRNAVVCLYSFYKNQANVLITIFAAAGNAFSGSNVVNPWLMQCYNLVHCHVPLFLYGMYDRASDLADLTDEPEGHAPNLFGYDIQLVWMAAAALQATLIRALWCSSTLGLAGEVGPDLSQSAILGNLCFISVVLCVNVTLMLRQYSWSRWIALTYLLNFIGLIVTLAMFVPGLVQVFEGTNFLRVSLICIVTLVLTTLIGEILILSAELFMSGVDSGEDEKSLVQVVHVMPAAEPLQPFQSQTVPDLEMSRKGSNSSRLSVSARRSSLGYAYSEECSLEREKERWSHMAVPSQVSCAVPSSARFACQSNSGAGSKELQPETIELSSFRGP
ncbi:DRS2 [Symbiodinium natans]|uniref:P-type phospholipid transporter n=1 Tax=Symbiodinium natans TaxID=878477 RepID=A0A812L2P5_9DINO|nr:DRS2 [Symbiodinium natans]